jgi:copper chaperone CopZ
LNEKKDTKSGSLGAPLVAAACWWIPLFLLFIALTIESLASSPERFRLFIVAVAAVMLSFGFFLVYTKRPRGSSYRGLWRFNVVMTWVVAAGLVAFAASPPQTGQRPPEVGVVDGVAPGVSPERLAGAAKKRFAVKGMVCQSCVETVTEALLGVPGVLAADVELEGESATVSLDASSAPADSTLVAAVVEAGYRAWPIGSEDEAVMDEREDR